MKKNRIGYIVSSIIVAFVTSLFLWNNCMTNVNAADIFEEEFVIYGDYECCINIFDGTARIVGYNGSETDIVIPNIIKSDYYFGEYKVIGVGGFKDNKSIKSVVIPSGVEYIFGSAFSGCSSLEHIVIPDSVTSINNYAFSDCTNIETVELPFGIEKIGYGAFNGCSSLSKIDIPNNVKTIGSFSGCTSLKTIKIPFGIEKIEDSTFSGCSSLSKIDIPDSVISIGSNAFRNCSSLTNIRIPDSVTSIGTSAFEGCSNLDSIIMSDNVTCIDWNTFNNCTSLKSIVLPEGIETIEEYAFINCSELSEVILPNSVSKIDYYAFKKCTSLNSIEIPDGVTYIGNEAFNGCTSLSTVYIPKTINTIAYGAFDSCDIKSVYYGGTKKQWSEIRVNYTPKSATVYYNQDSIGYGDYVCGNLESVDVLGFEVTIDGTVYGVTDDFDMGIPFKIMAGDGSKKVICSLEDGRISEMTEDCVCGLSDITSDGDISEYTFNNETNECFVSKAGSVSLCCDIVIPAEKGNINEKAIISSVKWTSSDNKAVKVHAIIDDNKESYEEDGKKYIPIIIVVKGIKNGVSVIQGESLGGESVSTKVYVTFFAAGVDGNSFSNIGMIKVKSVDSIGNKYITSADNYNKLTNGVSWAAKKKIESLLFDKGDPGAWCYGISMTQAFTKKGILDVTEYGSSNANYYNMPGPDSNMNVRDMLTLYHLSQWRDDIKPTKRVYKGDNLDYILSSVNWIHQDDYQFDKAMLVDEPVDYWKSFIDSLKKSIRKEEILILSLYYIPDNEKEMSGHELVACGFDDSDSGYFNILLFDCNHQNQYSHLYISKDYKRFFVSPSANADYNKKEYADNNNWRILAYHEWDDIKKYAEMGGLISSSGSGDVSFTNENTITFSTGSKFVLTGSDGKTLSFDGERFSGNISISSFDIKGYGSDMSYVIGLDSSEQFTISGLTENTNISASIGNVFTSGTFSSGNVIDFSSSGVSIKGPALDVDCSVGTAETDGLINVNCEGTGSVDIKCEGQSIEVKSDNPINNTVISWQYTDKSETVEDKGDIASGDLIIDIKSGSSKDASETDQKKTTEKSTVTPTNQDKTKAPAKVALKSVKNNKGKKLTAKWKKVTGAKGYEVQYSTNKKFKKAKTKTTKKTTLTIKKLKKKKVYYVRVRAYTIDSSGKKVPGKWSKVKKVKIKK